tara:strand:- start:366 stop:641 length:276 start_codon:yes stop_codon:yes gene_type:complete
MIKPIIEFHSAPYLQPECFPFRLLPSSPSHNAVLPQQRLRTDELSPPTVMSPLYCVGAQKALGLMIAIIFKFWLRVRDDNNLERLGRYRQR